MKLTESMLRKIIREEARKLTEMGNPFDRYVGPGYKTLDGSNAEIYQRQMTSVDPEQLARIERIPTLEVKISELRRMLSQAKFDGRLEAAKAYQNALDLLTSDM